MTTFQDPPLSRRAVRQNEREQAEPDATSVDPAAAPEAPAEPLTYATQSRPPVPEYDGPSFRVRETAAADSDEPADAAVAPQQEGGYRPRDFSPEGRRATSSPSWAPQYGGVGDDGALEYQTQGRVPAPIAPASEPVASEPAATTGPPTGSLAATLGAPVGSSAPSASAAPAFAAPASEGGVAVPADDTAPTSDLSPITDDVLGPIEHTLTRRELRALRDAHRLRTASTPGGEPSGDLAPQAAPSSRLDSAVAEFDALAQAREATGVDEPRAAPRGRRAYAPATNDVSALAAVAAAEQAPAAEAAAQPEAIVEPEPEPEPQVEVPQPEPEHLADPQVDVAAADEAPTDTAVAFDEDAAFADPAFATPATEVEVAEPVAEQPWAPEQQVPAEPIPLVEPPAYSGYTAPQPVALAHTPPAPVMPNYSAPEPVEPSYVAPEVTKQATEQAPEAFPVAVEPEELQAAHAEQQPEPERVEVDQPDLEHDPFVAAPPAAETETPATDSPLSAFEALFAPPSDTQQEQQPEQFVAQPAPEAPTFEHAVYAHPEPQDLPRPETSSAAQPEPTVLEQPVPDQPVYAQPPVAETVYAVPVEPAADAHVDATPVAEPIAELPVVAEPAESPAEPVTPEAAEQAPAAEIVIPEAPAPAPAATTTTVTEVDVDPSAPSVGHWSTQAELEDETQQGSATLAGGVGIGSAPLTTSALVLPSIPDQFGPNTGEILVTGSISLPESFSVTGAHPAQLDESDLDHMLDPGDHQVASTDSQPVRAIRAVSTHTSSRNVISTTKPKGNRALTVLIVAASAMAAVVITLLVVGLASGQL